MNFKEPKFKIGDEAFYWSDAFGVLNRSVIDDCCYSAKKDAFTYKVKGRDNFVNFSDCDIYKTKKEAFESIKVVNILKK